MPQLSVNCESLLSLSPSPSLPALLPRPLSSRSRSTNEGIVCQVDAAQPRLLLAFLLPPDMRSMHTSNARCDQVARGAHALLVSDWCCDDRKRMQLRTTRAASSLSSAARAPRLRDCACDVRTTHAGLAHEEHSVVKHSQMACIDAGGDTNTEHEITLKEHNTHSRRLHRTSRTQATSLIYHDAHHTHMPQQQ
jgi:hypothetical protein